MALKRLDTIVSAKINVSRSFAAKLIEDKKVSHKKNIIDKPSKKLDEDTVLKIDFNPNIEYPDINIEIIYEDSSCYVINKPSGVLTHSKGAFNPEATVATWLHRKNPGLNTGDPRAGIIHRLDRGTSGVMIVAKNQEALKYYQKQFAKRNVKKTYTALVNNRIDPKQAIIDIPITRNAADPKRFKVSKFGKPAQTEYKIIEEFSYSTQDYYLVELKPKTGRTHQIRLHLKYLKAPIVGDDFYGGHPADRLYLHSSKLELTLSDSKRKEFFSSLPIQFHKPKIS